MLGPIHYFSSTMTLVLSAQISGTFLSRNLNSSDKYLVSFSFSWLCGFWDFSSPTSNCTQAMAVKTQNLNHQGTPLSNHLLNPEYMSIWIKVVLLPMTSFL